jgi:hypothetical protein
MYLAPESIGTTILQNTGKYLPPTQSHTPENMKLYVESTVILLYILILCHIFITHFLKIIKKTEVFSF